MEKQEREIGFDLLWKVLKNSFLWLLIVAAACGILAGVFNEVSQNTTYTADIWYVITSRSDSPATIQADVVTIINAKQTTREIMKDAGIDVSEESNLNAIHGMVTATASGNNALVVVSVTGTNTDTIVQIAQAYEKYLPDYMTGTIYAGRNTTLRPFNADSDMQLIPNGKGTLKQAALFAAIGFALAYIVFFILELANNKVRGAATLREFFADVPVLGKIPTPDGKAPTNKSNLPASAWLASSSEAIADAYRGLRVSVAQHQNEGVRVIGVTSSENGEGSNVVAISLAQSYVQLGKRVLVIEADMRTPSIKNLLNLDVKYGLAELLTGAVVLQNALVKDVSGIEVIPVVAETANSAELLASAAFADLISSIAHNYDLVLVSFAAMGELSDAPIVANQIDGYLTVARAERTRLSALQLVVSEMKRFNMKNIGFVVIDDISKA